MTANSKQQPAETPVPTADAANGNTPEQVAIVNGCELQSDDEPVPMTVPTAGEMVRRHEEWIEKGISPEAIEKAIEAEAEMAAMGADRFRKWVNQQLGRGAVTGTPGGKELARRVLGGFMESITRFQAGEKGLLDPNTTAAILAKAGRPSGQQFRDLIKDEDALDIASITLQCTISAATQGLTMVSAVSELSRALETHCKFQTLARASKKLADNNAKEAARRNEPGWKAEKRIDASLDHLGVAYERWDRKDARGLALSLIHLFIRETGFVVDEPVKTFKRGRVRVENYLVLTPDAEETMKNANDRAALMTLVATPFLVPPRDWKTPVDGIFWSDHARHVTLSGVRARRPVIDALFQAHRAGQLDTVYSAVNAVQATPFRINKRVFDVMSYMWDGEVLVGGDMVQREPLPIPAKPAQDAGEEVWADWKQQAATIHNENRTSLSKRYAIEKCIDQARDLRTHDAFWYGWYCDYRGRMYTVQSGLTPQGKEIEKALLEFAIGEPLDTPDAVYWLAVHGANSWGEDSGNGVKTDKLPLDKRAAWAHEHTKKIIACAKSPLTTTWWRTADKPWLFLAFCFDWADYVAAKEAGRVHYSHLSVALDGTCNGLQHLSALVRDPVGAVAVNLEPSEEPADIYADAAERATEMLRQSVQTGSEFARGAGDMLEFGLDRKITKRTVMTIPYGVSQHSSNDYIREALEERAKKTGKQAPWRTKDGDLDRDRLRETRGHTEITIWNAVVETIGPAMGAMQWIQGVASVAGKQGKHLSWVAPSGWPVVQLYFKKKNIQSDMSDGQGGRITSRMALDTKDVSVADNKGGSAPNVVHSLDASHMVATINGCLSDGVYSFMMIHDSFGTHARNAARLHYNTRHAFADMYANNVLAGLHHQWVELYGVIDPAPEQGEFDAEVVRDSMLFFS